MRNVRWHRSVLWLCFLAILSIGCPSERSEKGELYNEGWLLIKKSSLPNGDTIRVFQYNIEMGALGSQQIMQNRISVKGDGREAEFSWETGREFSGGWSEVVLLEDGSIAVVLFHGEWGVRVVRYKDGVFVFRPEKDELTSATELSLGRIASDGVRVKEDESGQIWIWGPSSGFLPDAKSRP